MQNFTFHNPTKIIFGKSTIGALKREVPAGKKIIMLIYGGGSIKRNGTYGRNHGGARRARSF